MDQGVPLGNRVSFVPLGCISFVSVGAELVTTAGQQSESGGDEALRMRIGATAAEVHTGRAELDGGNQTDVDEDEANQRADTSHVPCKFFRQGACQAGKACPFSHDLASVTDNVCKYFAKVCTSILSPHQRESARP